MAYDGAMSPTIPDWYPDPRSEAPLRYWDGEEWTSHVAPLNLARHLDDAKAHRPWYRKKRVMVPLGVALVVAMFAGLGQVPAGSDAAEGAAPAVVVASR